MNQTLHLLANRSRILGCILCCGLALSAWGKDQVGPLGSGAYLVPTYQLLHPVGQSLTFGGRPVDLALSPGAKTVYVKDNRGLVVIDASDWSIRQELHFQHGGGSTHGLALTRDGSRLFVGTAQNILWEAKRLENGNLAWERAIRLPGPKSGGVPGIAGIALSPDEKTAYVCLSRNNSVGEVDLRTGKLVRQIPTGVAPYDVVLRPHSSIAFVSNWGGRHPEPAELRADSSGTATVVDDRGVAASGTISVLDLQRGRQIAQIKTGLHPCSLALSHNGRLLFVANANSDTVSLIDTASFKTRATIVVRPDPDLPFGSAPNALCLSPDDTTLFVADGGNNAVAVLKRVPTGAYELRGFIPTAWYPGAVATDGRHLFVANVKGLGSRNKPTDKPGFNSHMYLGTVSKVAIPTPKTLAADTVQVRRDIRIPQILRRREKAANPAKPVPVPLCSGDPSVFEHVVYILKENRSYDQVFGDLPQGNSDPQLCVFGRKVTPNHHALAEEFALLDNYYCNGVLSADGHAWAMEGYATDYLEKSFGGWTRSYPYSGDDPLSFASSGFIWDDALLHGVSFRNYGEMRKTYANPRNASFLDIYRDYQQGGGKIHLEHITYIDTLQRYSCPDSPGWNLRVPDVWRARVFLKEFQRFENEGNWPNLIIVYLPDDHTSGTRPGAPTPRAQVADNDLALGRIVDRISHSRFWKSTCIFVNEDDPQAGFDHVDGHRSLCLVVSPYTKRGAVVSHFYNQTSVLHTIERIFGLPPMNQMDARAPLMTGCFQATPDLTPYTCRPNNIPLDEMNRPAAELHGPARTWALKSLKLPLGEPDRADEDTLNRIIWHSVKGPNAPYPARFAGAHGRGLRALHLRFAPARDND